MASLFGLQSKETWMAILKKADLSRHSTLTIEQKAECLAVEKCHLIDIVRYSYTREDFELIFKESVFFPDYKSLVMTCIQFSKDLIKSTQEDLNQMKTQLSLEVAYPMRFRNKFCQH
jgi:hypothetical protein